MQDRASFRVTGLLGLMVCGGAWLEARHMPSQPLSAGLGPAFFPTLLLGLLATLSVGLLLYSALGRFASATEAGGSEAETGASGNWAACGLLFLLLLLFGISLERVNALITSFAFLGASMMLLGERWWKALVYAAIVTAPVYILFGLVFGLSIFR
ncbi:tripartite tricarboxylate transporter TctB family protein [Aquibaculum sediminis]|uniref:tripartite tricarboxylate transporter TctB family protein n=1 Tax=Aquibaculum sediminis TaxID=3231907 RepID=UPI0034540985